MPDDGRKVLSRFAGFSGLLNRDQQWRTFDELPSRPNATQPDYRRANPFRQHDGAFCRTCSRLRPRQPVFYRGLPGVAQVGIPAAGGTEGAGRRADARWPKSCVSSDGLGTTRHRRRSRSTCTCTGPASPPISAAPAINPCGGCWKRPPAARIFAAGHAEAGNDIPVLLSTTKAEKVNGGYRFTGRKYFGSLSPVWTFLGIHGMDTSGPTPKIVHAFLPRDAQGFASKKTGT